MAFFFVNTIDDIVDPDDGRTSLREAVTAANDMPGHDEIVISRNLDGETLALSLGELVITDDLSIDGDVDDDGTPDITIDANADGDEDASTSVASGNTAVTTGRVFSVVGDVSEVALNGLILTGGHTSADGFAGGGGAVRAAGDFTTVSLENTHVLANSTSGAHAHGGGILVGSNGRVNLTNSVVSDNVTTGFGSQGGGIAAGGNAYDGAFLDYGYTSLTDSLVSNNRTEGDHAHGGGIAAYGTDAASSAISDNATYGAGARGGGVAGSGGKRPSLDLLGSTLIGNSTQGTDAHGGGFDGHWAEVVNSTVGNNSTSGQGADGGGLHASYGVVTNSTITGNSTAGADADGGGIFGRSFSGNFALTNSIVSGNSSAEGASDDVGPQSQLYMNSYAGGNIIGSALGLDGAVPTDAGLTPADVFAAVDPTTGGGLLADNGGAVQTVALNAAGLAIDAGDAALATERFGAPLVYDARGEGFARVVGEEVDLGAYEYSVEWLDPFFVTTAEDVVDASDGVTSLREAIERANAEADLNEITFAEDLSGAAIHLQQGELLITEAVRIDGDLDDDGTPDVTIDANADGDDDASTSVAGGNDAVTASRVFNIAHDELALYDDDPVDVTLDGLVLTGGHTTADRFDGAGGAIRAAQNTNLALDNTHVLGNSTAGSYAHGGGVVVGAGDGVTLTNSVVSGNLTTGYFAQGGGIAAGAYFEGASYSATRLWYGRVIVHDSVVSGNRTEGERAAGGGIAAASTGAFGSTIRDNATYGDSAWGGGIYGAGVQTGIGLTDSTVSGNSTHGKNADAGGFYAYSASVINSTISNNSTSGDYSQGGGLLLIAGRITNSTITGNSTAGIGSDGGGIWVYSDSYEFDLTNSIVAGNSASAGASDEIHNLPLLLTTRYDGGNIIGSALGVDGATPSAVGLTPADVFAAVDPTTGGGLLADNGGKVYTVALKLAGPAVDSGDASVAARPYTGDPLVHDARGDGFARVVGADVDLGAFEVQDGLVANVILGTPEDDVLIGTQANDAIYGLAGDDRLMGWYGVDRYDGGDGTDTVDFSYSTQDGTLIDLRAGLVTFTVGIFEKLVSIENVIGSTGDDVIRGDRGDNVLMGGDGDDLLTGWYGVDSYDGGEGTDTVDFSYSRQDGTEIDLLAGTARFAVGIVERMISIENVIGSTGDDVITGDHGDNVLKGSGGDDRLMGWYGVDRYNGGDGVDTVDFSYSTQDGTRIDLLAGVTRFSVGIEERMISIENVIGSMGDDVIIGDQGDNVLEGGDGNDRLMGWYGVDRYDGGAGNDTVDFSYSTQDGTLIDLAGGIARFTVGIEEQMTSIENIVGSTGDDLLRGDGGANRLNGNAGFDIVLIDGLRADYEVLTDGAITTITSLTDPGDVDTLTNIEQLSFADGDLLL